MKKRFHILDNGACLIIHDDLTGINRASCYSSEDAKVICNALENLEKRKQQVKKKKICLPFKNSDFRFINGDFQDICL
jgi:hypothetical protein